MIGYLKSTPAVATDPYAQQVTARAIDLLFRGLPRSSGTMLMPLVLTWLLWGRVSHTLLIAWCAAILASSLVVQLLSVIYSRRVPPPAHAARWGHYFSFAMFVNGVIWGVASLLFFVPDSTALQVFLFTSIIGLCAGSISLLPYWLESYYAFIVPPLSLSALRLFLEGGAEYQALAALVIMAMVVLLLEGHNAQKSVLAAVRLGFENLDLVERLREEKAKVEAANRDKTRFLASASHDLRQPVHALTLFADALHPQLTSAKAHSLLDNMNRSIEALNQLLGSLLDISKLDADIIKPSLLHFPVHVLLDQLNTEYAPQAHAKGLDWRVDAGQLIVHSDPVLLDTLLRNLISNAIRYTHAGGIEISCTALDANIRIDIADTGVGIPSDQHQDIFREFYQLENPERDRSKGLGLGLAIVDRLASLLEHRVTLDSEPGKGSRFAVILPAGDLTAVIRPTVRDFGQDDVSGLRIVVIDDEAAVREGMQAVLEGWGCETLLAGSEDEALEKIKAHGQAPQVIISDYRLRDGKTGEQAIERLRREFGGDIPALIITGDTAPDRLHEAQESGHTLMHKPVQPGKLRAYLRRVQRNALSPDPSPS